MLTGYCDSIGSPLHFDLGIVGACSPEAGLAADGSIRHGHLAYTLPEPRGTYRNS